VCCAIRPDSATLRSDEFFFILIVSECCEKLREIAVRSRVGLLSTNTSKI
jgi:hypothetical protein